MAEDYQAVVLAKYKEMTEEEKISLGLFNPTRGTFRKACINSFNKRHFKEDEDVFAEFFGVDKIDTDFYQLLNKSDADDFKAIHNHIVGNNKSDNTDMKNTELLAWLIDFQPRPSYRYYEAEKEKERSKEIKGSNQNEIETSSSAKDVLESSIVQGNLPIISEPEKETKKLNFIQRTGIVATMGLIMGVAYWKGVPPDGCMYWTGTEYKAVDCDAQIPNTQIVALNQQKIDHFKKITLPDTITFNSLSKVWYSKINNEVEFFTGKGKHPTKTDRTLKPITTHILSKYSSNRLQSLVKQPDTIEKD